MNQTITIRDPLVADEQAWRQLWSFLEDLFVNPQFRLAGVGRRLMQDVVDRARTNQWSRVYWHTRVSNPARRLYDKFAQADDFVRYRLLLQ